MILDVCSSWRLQGAELAKQRVHEMAAEKKAGNAQKPPVFPFKLGSCNDIILFYPTPPLTIEKGEGPPEMYITYIFNRGGGEKKWGTFILLYEG